MRRLMHYGQIFQSHVLHFFHLASPDLLFGMESDPARRNIVGVIDAFPEIGRKAVLMRKFGQEVIRVTAGKKIHGTGAIPGGINKHLTTEERDALLVGTADFNADRMVEWAQEGLALFKALPAGAHGADRRLCRLSLELPEPGARRRRHGPVSRRAARGGQRRRDDLRPRGLPALRGLHRRGDPQLDLHEVPLHPQPRPGARAGTGSVPWRD